jgi:hypothetical protein
MTQATARRCRWCAKGYERLMLDADGTQCAISQRPGVWAHARDDHYWPCEAACPLPVNMERYRDPFNLLGHNEDSFRRDQHVG